MYYSAESRFFCVHREHIFNVMLLNKGHLKYMEWMVGHNLLNPAQYCDVLLRVAALPHLQESWDEDLIVREQVHSVMELIQRALFMETATDNRIEMLRWILQTCPHNPPNHPITLCAKLQMWYDICFSHSNCQNIDVLISFLCYVLCF